MCKLTCPCPYPQCDGGWHRKVREMSEDIKYMKLRTKNCTMMQMYGDKLTASEWARKARTNGLHTELEHTDRYGGISQSCTMSDGCNGHRFKLNTYKHSYRWSTLYIPCTAEQEARVFKKGCEMAGIVVASNCITDLFDDGYRNNGCWYGPDHIKYDKGAAFFSFISKRNIWKASKVNMICNRACAVVLLEGWPNMLDILKARTISQIKPDIKGRFLERTLDPARLTPEELHYQAEYYFKEVDRPNQQDIDNIIKEVNDKTTQEQEKAGQE